MRKQRLRCTAWLVCGTAAVALGLPVSPPAGAQLPVVPVGGEFQVNTYTTGYQLFPSVAVDADGDFVVVWASNGIVAQRYASDGSTQGGEFQVNAFGGGQASVATDPEGDFVVVWSGSAATDPSGIQGQRYASNGSMQGAQFQVNTYTTNSQFYPEVAADPDGDFVVVWRSNGSSGTDTSYSSIQGQRYASDGSTRGAEFQVNTFTTDWESYPAVAVDADGDFVVAWNSITGSLLIFPPRWFIHGQRYASDGSAQGAEFQVNTYTTTYNFYPDVAADADGDFVVVWRTSRSFGNDTSSGSIQGVRYASNGSALGAQFQVNTYTTSVQESPSVATDADGDFVVVWHSNGSFGTDTSSWSLQGQRYASDGSTQGAQFQVNTYTTSYQTDGSVATDADGGFVVVWESNSFSMGFSNIQGQRFRVPAAAPLVPAMSPATRFALAAALLLLGATYALRRR